MRHDALALRKHLQSQSTGIDTNAMPITHAFMMTENCGYMYIHTMTGPY